jgi:hypothetical protein
VPLQRFIITSEGTGGGVASKSFKLKKCLPIPFTNPILNSEASVDDIVLA